MFDDNNMNNGYQQFSTEPPKPPKKTHSASKVVALIAAVAIVGGGAGFGGAYLAGMANSAIVSAESGSSISATANSSAATDNDGGSSAAGSTVSDDEEITSGTTLNDLQADATLNHKVNSAAEYNTDGTFMYTRDLVSAVRDSIVYIEVYVNYRGESTLYGSGSGIVISSDGYILTNAHVVDDMDSYTVQVTTTDPDTGTGVSETYDATLVGSDTDTDIAVLKIDAENLQAAVLGDSDQLSVGDDVVIIGNPLGLETSVSKGIVSGLNRQLSSNDRSLSSIQTDAAINSGNSGGAMFNMYGEVVGVVNEKLVSNYSENLGFAITINEAKSFINDLVSKGYVTGRPILGITCLQVSEYVAAIQGMTPGLYVTSIDSSLAIAQSELVVGDTITKINGTSVTTTSEVSTILNSYKPGDSVTVTVVRSDSLGRDREYSFDVILSEYNGG
jgi:serine protease Do